MYHFPTSHFPSSSFPASTFGTPAFSSGFGSGFGHPFHFGGAAAFPLTTTAFPASSFGPSAAKPAFAGQPTFAGAGAHLGPTAGETAPAGPRARLTYFPSRGLSEVLRYTLAAGNIEWEEVHITSIEQWQELKASGKLPFDQVPLLEMDGGCLVQSVALIRAVARKAGLYASSASEAYFIDAAADAANDLIKIVAPLAFNGRSAEAMQNLRTKTHQKIIQFERLMEHNQVAHGQRGPWLVGNRLTIADLAVACALRWAAEELGEASDELFAPCEHVPELIKAVESNPGVARYLDGPNRLPLPDQAAVDLISSILSK